MQASRKINKKSKKFYNKSPQLNIIQGEVFTLLLEEHMYTFVRDKNIFFNALHVRTRTNENIQINNK
jgi:hypothetical protein